MSGHRALVLGALVLFAAAALLPLGVMFVATLFDADGHFTFAAYSSVLASGRQWILLGHSLQVAAGATGVALLLGLPLAFLTARTNVPLRGLFSVLYAAPLFMPTYVVAICWRYFIGDVFGVHHAVERWLGLDQALWQAHGYALCAFYLGLALFPMVTLTTRASLLSADPSLDEAALLARGGRAAALRLALRLATPGIAAGAAFVFLFALSEFGVPNLLMINTYAIEVYSQFKAFYDVNAATASSVPLVALSLIPLLAMRFVERDKRYALARSERPAHVYALGAWRWPAFACAAFVILIGVVVPVATLFVVAGPFENYRKAIALTGEDFLNSIVFALLAATGATALGFALAYGAARSRGRAFKGALDAVSVLPFAIPAGVLAIGFIRLWNRPGIFNLVYGTGAIVVLGFAARFVPFAFRASAAALRHAPVAYEEAALVAGVPFRRRFASVAARLSARGLVAAWIVVFVLALGELNLTILVAPAGSQTLPLRIFNMIHFSYNSLVAALCLLLVGLAIFPAAVVALAVGRKPEVR